MAQTKRKRRSKHRGTAAGTIQSRGRTGRPLSPEERKKEVRAQAREKRLNTPPTWRSSASRASLAAGIMFIFLMVTQRGGVGQRVGIAAGFAVIAMILYIPLGYYMELFLFRRRMRRKVGGR